MKRLSIVLFGILVSLSLQGQNIIKTEATLKHATVFLNSAQLSSAIATTLPTGESIIEIRNLPPHILTQSIQVGGKGSFTILGVKHTPNYLEDQTPSPEMQALEDSVEQMGIRIEVLRTTKDVLTKEEQMIMANQNLKGSEENLTADELEEMADFFRERLTDIREEQLQTSLKVRKQELVLTKYRQQLAALQQYRNKRSSIIQIMVSSTGSMAKLELEYIVGDCGWYPVYDFRVKDTKGGVQLQYKAKVYQNTGMEWKDVKLTLSTANPNQSGNKPDLYPWYVELYVPKPVSKYASAPMKKAEVTRSDAYNEDSYEMEEKDIALENAGYTWASTTVAENTTSVEFTIGLPYSIPSDAIGQLVDVKMHELPATYTYASAPKLDSRAFLMARVTDWGQYNLLSGEANIYFEGTFVGTTMINVQEANDTLNLSLGSDGKVIVNRERIKDMSTTKVINSNTKKEEAWKIKVVNTKSVAIDIIIEDQIPLSRQSEITIEMVENTNGVYDATTGKVTWTLHIEPNQQAEVVLRYDVKFPKGKTVSGL